MNLTYKDNRNLPTEENKMFSENTVFYHLSEMKNGQFIKKDKFGLLLAHLRDPSAIFLLGKVKTLVTVGGPSLDGESKAEIVRNRLLPFAEGTEIIALDSKPNTGGNIEAIMRYLADKNEHGIKRFLTNYYHIPRLTIQMFQNGMSAVGRGFKLIPLCAEAILFIADKAYWRPKIEALYGVGPIGKRIMSEIEGLTALELDNYYPSRTK